jgi:ribosomal protein L11 methyltransferase
MRTSTYCLNLIVDTEKYEPALAMLYEAGMLGCEEKSLGHKIHLKAIFADKETAAGAAARLKPAADQEGEISEIPFQDWNAKWRETMKPARLERGWWVSPCWLPPPKTARNWIKIEPKMAFGTGHHETTRLAAKAIIARKKLVKNKRVLDIGTGSGVLCFAAARCGARSAIGIEIDFYCRENLAENRRDNAGNGTISFVIGPVEAIRRTARFDIAVMNMILTESAPLLDTVAQLLEDNGMLIWSGILTDEGKKAGELAERSGFACAFEKTENEWWCGTFVKKQGS